MDGFLFVGIVLVAGLAVCLGGWLHFHVEPQIARLEELEQSLSVEQTRHCRALTGHDDRLKELRGELGTFGRWLALATANEMRVKELEARVNRLDPFGAPLPSVPDTERRG